MVTFHFQQFASRGRQGYQWRENAGTSPVSAWLPSFQTALERSGIVPNNSDKLSAQQTGGFYLSPDGKSGVIFAFLPAPKDFYGREGGIVTNALFFAMPKEVTDKSLKKTWEHSALKAAPDADVPEKIGIQLDCDFGRTDDESRFFSLASASPGTIIGFDSVHTSAPIPVSPPVDVLLSEPPTPAQQVCLSKPAHSDPQPVIKQGSDSKSFSGLDWRLKLILFLVVTHILCVLAGIIIGYRCHSKSSDFAADSRATCVSSPSNPADTNNEQPNEEKEKKHEEK